MLKQVLTIAGSLSLVLLNITNAQANDALSAIPEPPPLTWQDPNYNPTPKAYLKGQWQSGFWITETELGEAVRQGPSLTSPVRSGINAKIGSGIQWGPMKVTVDLNYTNPQQKHQTQIGFSTVLTF